MDLIWSVASDAGREGGQNQDAHTYLPLNAHAGLWFAAVADGVGGHPAADVASRIAVKTLRRELEQHLDGEMLLPAPLKVLTQGMREAHRELRAVGAARPEWHGMCTTLTAAVITPEVLLLAHVGDSRAYLVRPDQLERLTRDHSLAGSLVRINAVSEREAIKHPGRHLLMGALGAQEEPSIDTIEVGWEAGNVLLLCTDGVAGAVTTDRLEKAVRRVLDGHDFQEFAAKLVERAEDWDGRDNLTVLACQMNGGAAEEVHRGGPSAG